MDQYIQILTAIASNYSTYFTALAQLYSTSQIATINLLAQYMLANDVDLSYEAVENKLQEIIEDF